MEYMDRLSELPGSLSDGYCEGNKSAASAT